MSGEAQFIEALALIPVEDCPCTTRKGDARLAADLGAGLAEEQPHAVMFTVNPFHDMVVAGPAEPRPMVGDSITFYEYRLHAKVTLDATGAPVGRTEVVYAGDHGLKARATEENATRERPARRMHNPIEGCPVEWVKAMSDGGCRMADVPD